MSSWDLDGAILLHFGLAAEVYGLSCVSHAYGYSWRGGIDWTKLPIPVFLVVVLDSYSCQASC